MGGHGALTLYLSSVLGGMKQYRSVSAFAPIANPVNCPWGQKAFAGYLQGGVEEARERYDATELVKRLGKAPVHVLVDYVRSFLLLSLPPSLFSFPFCSLLTSPLFNKENWYPS